jgi:DNA-binding GntR family transcriptional regulator
MATLLRERVAAQIRELIVDGEFAPGSRLVEREICDRLGVSRATTREAYRILEAEGLIVMTANRGPSVANMSVRAARDVYTVREAIECSAVRLFVERASSSQVSELRDALDEVRIAHRSGDVTQMLRVKSGFYEVLYAGADNPLLWEHARRLNHQVAHLRQRSLSQPGRPRESMKEMDAVFRAIRARDAALAESLWRQHIRNAATSALGSLVRLEYEAAPAAGADPTYSAKFAQLN